MEAFSFFKWVEKHPPLYPINQLSTVVMITEWYIPWSSSSSLELMLW